MWTSSNIFGPLRQIPKVGVARVKTYLTCKISTISPCLFSFQHSTPSFFNPRCKESNQKRLSKARDHVRFRFSWIVHQHIPYGRQNNLNNSSNRSELWVVIFSEHMRKCQIHSVPQKIFTYQMEEITGTLLDKFQDKYRNCSILYIDPSGWNGSVTYV